MKTEFKLITPDYAKKLLGNGKLNRDLRKGKIAKYAQDMQSGNWFAETGEAIKIGKSGKLIDGYHRLNAVTEANVAIYFTIAYDVPDEAMAYLDTGSARTARDIFKIREAANAHNVPSIIQSYYKLKRGSKTLNTNTQTITLNNSEIWEIYIQNPKYWNDLYNQTYNWYVGMYKSLAPSLIGGLYKYFSDIHSQMAFDFFQEVCMGENYTTTSTKLLRDRLLNEKVSVKKTTPMIKIALIIKAWNAYRVKKSIKQLKFNIEEDFPVAI